MWQLISRTKQATLTVALTIIIILAFQAATELWGGRTPPLYKMVSLVAFMLSTVFAGIANLIWRWVWRRIPSLNRWLFPDLNGTWIGVLQTTWVDPTTNLSPGPIETTVTIRQTLFDISVKMQTGESGSYSTRVIPEAEPQADRYRLWYSYDNRPIAKVQHRSTPHEGVAWLEIALGENADRLTGQYYTSRKTTGDIELTRGV